MVFIKFAKILPAGKNNKNIKQEYIAVVMDTKIKKIIAVAIKAEQDAQRIYNVGIGRSGIAAGRALFRRLVNEEKKHETALRKLLKGEITLSKPPIGGDMKLAESISLTPLSELGEVLQIIKFAIGKEKGAQRRYRRMAKLFAGKARAMLQNFEMQEKRHELLLKNEGEKLK